MTEPAASVRDATRALRQRKKRRRQRRLRIAAAVAGLVLILGFVTWLVVFSPAFSADRVEVTGNTQVDPAIIVEAAQVPLGKPLVRVDTDAIREKVEELDAVESAEVTRHLTGVVEIHIAERSAVFAWVDGELVILVDAAGKAFVTVAAIPDGLLGATMVEPSERMLADTATAVAALGPLRDMVTGITVTSIDHIEFSLTTGAVLLWGSADQSDVKAEVAEKLITSVVAGHYDVSAPAHPATRP